MVILMGSSKRKDSSVENGYTVQECVETLLNILRMSDHPVDVEHFEFKYHLDIGLLVRVQWKGIPNIMIFGSWLQEATGLGWVVHSINPIEESEVYNVVFLLEEEI